ncbi:MAG TPA: hypothetical protein VEU30_06135 [Thermoanaerobaculia bacterium]|nr:hypothetical protein [Thermoanaerobaculia bacterium]
MSKSEHPAPLMIPRAVSRKHAERFAEAWYDLTCGDGSMDDAFSETELIDWPYGTLDDHAAIDRYTDIVDDIMRRMCDELKPMVVESFLRAAREVFKRERALDK